MRLPISLQWPWLIVLCMWSIFSLAVFFFNSSQALQHTTDSSPESSGLPIRLKIPSINVDAFVERVGLTPLGAIEAPKDPANVAWFEKSVPPGDIGSAVIDGHFGWIDGRPAAFDELHRLKAGDLVYSEDGEGVVTTFVVREIRIYHRNERVPQVFDAGDGKAHLNLITCEGAWNAEQETYANRLVVFTDKQ